MAMPDVDKNWKGDDTYEKEHPPVTIEYLLSEILLQLKIMNDYLIDIWWDR